MEKMATDNRGLNARQAILQGSTFVLSMYICSKLGICTFYPCPASSPKPLADTTQRQPLLKPTVNFLQRRIMSSTSLQHIARGRNANNTLAKSCKQIHHSTASVPSKLQPNSCAELYVNQMSIC